ncbi:MAG: general secretion pathway protein GspF [Gammaproteobacteria bacterium]|nr:general secretion pathway protein GspF [Gammaproteobacteria bacterium]
MLSSNKIVRAHTTEEYVDMIKQALDEVFDLRQAIEFDEEFMSEGRALVDELEGCLKAVYESMKDGSYEFATGDLPYVALMKNYHEEMVPFRYLLKRINETHNKGLELKDAE